MPREDPRESGCQIHQTEAEDLLEETEEQLEENEDLLAGAEELLFPFSAIGVLLNFELFPTLVPARASNAYSHNTTAVHKSVLAIF